MNHPPTYDVILPVLDERQALPGVLASLPERYHPIVVENGSTDGSGDLARQLGATVVREEQRGFGAACWSGLLAARSELVCFMDCDGSLANRVLAGRARRASGVPLRDLGPMRAAPRVGLLELGLVDRRFGWPLEIVGRAATAGWEIVEVDVPYSPRLGRSKVTGTVKGTAGTIQDMRPVLPTMSEATP